MLFFFLRDFIAFPTGFGTYFLLSLVYLNFSIFIEMCYNFVVVDRYNFWKIFMCCFIYLLDWFFCSKISIYTDGSMFFFNLSWSSFFPYLLCSWSVLWTIVIYLAILLNCTHFCADVLNESLKKYIYIVSRWFYIYLYIYILF